MKLPTATAYTVIGDSIDLLKFSVNSVLENPGMDLKVLVICWKPTKEIEEFCNGLNIPLYIHHDDMTKGFLYNFYECMRMGFEKAETDIAMYFGPDQAFYKNWAINLVKYADKDRVIFPKLIEAGVLPSCHQTINFGITPDTFMKTDFEIFCSTIYEDKLKTPEEAGIIYSHPTRGPHFRPDAKPYAIFKETYWKHGGEPLMIVNGVTGDVKIIDILIDNGIKMFQSCGSITYHFQMGERNKKEVSERWNQ